MIFQRVSSFLFKNGHISHKTGESGVHAAPIDERHDPVWEENSLRCDPFAIVRTKCGRGNSLYAAVHPYESGITNISSRTKGAQKPAESNINRTKSKVNVHFLLFRSLFVYTKDIAGAIMEKIRYILHTLGVLSPGIDPLGKTAYKCAGQTIKRNEKHTSGSI